MSLSHCFRHWQRSSIAIGWFAVATLSTFCPQLAYAQQDGVDEEKKISLHTAAPLREVLENLFRSRAASCIIGPGVDGVVTVHLDNVPFDDALNYLLNSATPELTYSRDKNNVYVVKVKEKASASPAIQVTNQMPQTSEAPPTSVMFTGGDPVAEALQMQVTVLEARRAAMKVDMGDMNPALLQVSRQITVLQKAINDRRLRNRPKAPVIVTPDKAPKPKKPVTPAPAKVEPRTVR